MYSTASVACKNWHPDTTSGTYLPQNTREASYAIFPIILDWVPFTAPQFSSVFYSVGAQGDRLSSPSVGLGDTTSSRLVDSPARPSSPTFDIRSSL